jgi:hypothetical protein
LGRTGILCRLGCDGIIEFAVVEHLAPEAAINKVADVFEELAVNVRRNGRAGFRGINIGAHEPALYLGGGIVRSMRWGSANNSNG